jgi:hypothetical protein
MAITKEHSAVVDILKENGDWIPREDIAKAMKWSKGEWGRDNILKLDEMFRAGEIAKRLRPDTGFDVIYEYRYLPEKRHRREIIKHILCEYYNGQSIRLRDIAAALGMTSNQLSSTDYDYFLELLKDSESGIVPEAGDYRDRDAEPKYRCVPHN